MARPCFAAITLGRVPHLAILAPGPSKTVVMTGFEAASVSKYDYRACNYEVCDCQPMISPLPKGTVCELSSRNKPRILKTLTHTFDAPYNIKFAQDVCPSATCFSVKNVL